MPIISNSQILPTIIEMILITLRLSRFFMQITESISPIKTERMFTPAHTERTAFDSVMCNTTGIKVANGKTLVTTATIPSFVIFLLFILLRHLISFLPNRFADNKRAKAKINIAHGAKGNN